MKLLFEFEPSALNRSMRLECVILLRVVQLEPGIRGPEIGPGRTRTEKCSVICFSLL